MNVTYTPFIKRVSQIFNLTGNVSFSTIAALTSNIENSLHLGNPLPDGFSDNDLKNIRHLTDWYHMLTEAKDLAKAKNLYKFQTIMNLFNNRIKTPSTKLRMTLLSAHDTDLLPLYTDLNASSFACVE